MHPSIDNQRNGLETQNGADFTGERKVTRFKSEAYTSVVSVLACICSSYL